MNRISVALLSTTLLGSVLAMGCVGDEVAQCSGDLCSELSGGPTFEGVKTLAPDATGARIRVTWSPAGDDRTPPEGITYRIYVSTRAGRATTKPAVVTTAPGATSAYIGVTPLGVVHHVVVHAVDGDGIEEANTVEREVLAAPDNVAPTFAGIKSATPLAQGGAKLVWDPAVDDKTPPEGMRYFVYSDDGALVTSVDAVTEVSLPRIGQPNGTRTLLVRAVDAADNASQNAAFSPVTLGGDVDAPTFAGCVTVLPVGAKVLRVAWVEATDDTTPRERISYEVYVATVAGAQSFTAPSAKIVGKSTLLVRNLTPSTIYHVVCRARDAAGNIDANTTDQTTQTSGNDVAPTFSGATGVFDATLRTTTLSWSPATDDRTAAANIVYSVYEARGSADFDFDNPVFETVAGATSATLSNLRSHTAFRWVVRARDEDFNEDGNTLASGGTTMTSWSADVLPMFEQNCAVVGCHVAPISTGGLSLSTFNAYTNIVGINAGERPLLKRIAPGDSVNSYVYQKIQNVPGIAGNPMPAAGTGNVLSDDQKDALRSWIDQGAPQN